MRKDAIQNNCIYFSFARKILKIHSMSIIIIQWSKVKVYIKRVTSL